LWCAGVVVQQVLRCGAVWGLKAAVGHWGESWRSAVWVGLG